MNIPRETLPRALRTVAIGGALVLALPCAPAAAHDFWIEPTKWRPAPGELIGLHLFVGHHDEKEVVERREERIESFFVSLPPAEDEGVQAKPVAGAEGRAPAGYLKVERAGVHLVGYRSRNVLIELEPQAFEAYLREEGLERIVAERARRGESGRPGREAYSRSSKCLLRSGEAPSTGFDRPIGLALELVPLDDPFALGPGSTLRLRLLHLGRPLSGILVEGLPLAGSQRVRVAARSDDEGLVSFELPAPARWEGPWLFAGVHMTRRPEGSEQDWESLWASLTFEVPPAPPPGATDESGGR